MSKVFGTGRGSESPALGALSKRGGKGEGGKAASSEGNPPWQASQRAVCRPGAAAYMC